jgi:hypothetical protein
MVDVATADDTPYSFEKEDRIEEERRAAGMGLEWPTGQIRWRTGLLFFLFSPFFFWKLLLFLQHSVERRRGGFGKICN